MARPIAGGGEGRQERRRWWIRHAGAFLSLPSNLFLNRERAGSATGLGVGTSAAFGLQRRSLMFGIVLLAIMAALVGSLIAAPWGLSNPQAASAQQVCAVPILGLQTSPGILYISAVYPGIIFVNEDAVLANPDEVDPIYAAPQPASRPEYQIVASGEAFDDAAPWTSFEFFELSGTTIALSGTVEVDLEPLSRWSVRVRILCNSGDHSATVEDTVQVEKFRPFSLSLTLNGTAVYSLEEGQTGTLTMTLVNARDVFDRDVDYQLDLKTNPLIYPEEDNPIDLDLGEVTVTGGKAGNVSTLASGQRSVTWTLAAVQDNVVNDPDDATDLNGESAVEWAYVFIWTVDVGNGGLVKAPASWGGNLHVLDVDPNGVVPIATPAGNTPAQGKLLIGTVFAENEPITPEIHNIVCGNVVPIVIEGYMTGEDTDIDRYDIDDDGNLVTDANGHPVPVYLAAGITFNKTLPIDVDGEPIGGFGYRYEWRRSGVAIPGETGACYKVTVADIGHSFSAQVRFEDRLLNTETFSSVGSTGVVVSGPTIVATNGYFFEEPLTVDLTTMTYPYCHTGCGINELQLLPSNEHYPVGTKVGYQWIHVDAYGNRVYDRNEDGIIVGGAYSPGWATNTYSPTERWDDGQYLQVMVTFMAVVDGNAFTVTKLANVQTPLITQARSGTNTNNLEKISDTEESIPDAISDAEEAISDAGSRPALEPVTVPDQFNETLLETIPTNLTAWLPNLGGGVGLRWSATVGRQAGSGFEYRYKPTVFADTGFTAWQAAPGGTEARAVTIPNLINNVEYMFEVRSIGSSGGATEIHTIVYQHRVKDCTV